MRTIYGSFKVVGLGVPSRGPSPQPSIYAGVMQGYEFWWTSRNVSPGGAFGVLD